MMASVEGRRDRYKLRVSIQLERWEAYDYGDGERLQSTQDRLSVDDQVEIGTMTFLQVAQVLGRFHDLAETIREESKHRNPGG